MTTTRDIFRIRVKTKTGEIELEGGQRFVDSKLDQLPELMKKMDRILSGKPVAKTKAVSVNRKDKPVSSKKSINTVSFIVPNSFSRWFAKFPKNIRRADNLLIAGYFTQHWSVDDVFKLFLAKNKLAQLNIKLANIEAAINHLVNEELVLVYRKTGKLTLYKVTAKGQKHLAEMMKTK